MKLFAKRTRKVVDPEEAEKILRQQEAAEAETAKQEADQAIQELLKKNPSELNAKERRMVKRYKARVDESETGGKSESATEVEGSAGQGAPEKLENTEEEKLPTSDEKESHHGDQNNAGTTVASAEPPSTELDEEQVRTLLEKLNSKQRRKLVRKLDREGASVLNEVYQEAVGLIEADKAAQAADDGTKTTETAKASGEPPLDDPSSTDASGKKRKRKQQDWSSLPPEERLRREEQRRLQQEATERRASEGDLPAGTKKRHPLNSERRRANRRKPAWQRRSKEASEYNEHHVSGFHMRKLQHGAS
jgi:hypothetical protein